MKSTDAEAVLGRPGGPGPAVPSGLGRPWTGYARANQAEVAARLADGW